MERLKEVKKLKHRIKFVLSVSFFLLIIFLVANKDVIQIFFAGDIEEIGSKLDDHFLPMFVITFLLLIIQNFITFIPLILILSVNIAFYGFVYGLIWSWFASVVAATLIFICARYFFKERLEKRINDAIKQKAEERGFMYVLLARIFPFVPTNLVNIVSGISSISFKDFLLATSLGNFVYFFALSLLPLGLFSLDIELILLLICISLAIVYLYKKRKRKQQQLTLKKSS
jgi:uncharacterized membrane protein YdjX (TVP38/TMEM64 family)